MGRRSRKRAAGDGATAPGAAQAPERGGSTRAARDAARARRAAAVAEGRSPARRRAGKTSFEDRPPAPWGSFPLVEIVVFIALCLIVAGFFVRGPRGGTMLVGGLVLGSLGGLELSIREHFSGFRSHTTLLAGAVAFIAIALTFLLTRHSDARVLILPIAGIVFAVSFWLLRQAFVRRSGVGFRR